MLLKTFLLIIIDSACIFFSGYIYLCFFAVSLPLINMKKNDGISIKNIKEFIAIMYKYIAGGCAKGRGKKVS